MEPNFQTSFIPKKPVTASNISTSPRVGLLVFVSIFIFLTVLVATGGLYFYKQLMLRSITQMESDLNLAKSRFEPSKIVQLQVLDKRLRAANQILSRHVAISPIFKILQSITMKTVQYTRFEYDISPESSKVTIKMEGVAVGYRSVALQSDLFAEDDNLIDPVFSNLALDRDGTVLFDLEFSINPSLINYKQTLEPSIDAPAVTLPN
ncbi:hypothetical protein K8Q98_01705 [Candidatus Nomurabacteria bacterium]|nr:hypothetical protein [Candidatus Nomurabacteria bacterium]